MSCKELIPEVILDGVSVKQQYVGQSEAVKEFALGSQPDELFTVDISHTNLVQADTNLNGSISVFDLLNATTGPEGIYNVKFLVTTSPERAELIRDVINTIKQVSFFLYGDSDNETSTQTADSNEVKEFIKNPPAKASTKAKEAVETLDKCVTKVADAQQAASDFGVPLPGFAFTPLNVNLSSVVTAAASLATPAPVAEATSEVVVQSVQTLRDRIVDALTDNNVNSESFKPGDAIASYHVPLKVDSTQIKLREVDGVPSPVFVNQQEFQISFSDNQLKNLYLFVVPNLEYRENQKIVFTVRDYVEVPLVINFQPQVFGTTVYGDKKVDVEFLAQKPLPDPNKLVISTVEKFITGLLSKKAFDNWQAFAGDKAVVTEPMVSVGYNKKVNGVFFLNKEALVEKLTTYPGITERPESYQNALQSITITKVYKKDGKTKELVAPELYEGLEFQNKKVCGYVFQDEYDKQDFEYHIKIKAKNPWEQLLQYVMPRLTLGKGIVDALVKNVDTTSPMGKLVILNPVSGFFTDDFLNSDYYQDVNTSYKTLLEQLEALYNYILPGEGIDLKARELVNTQQLYDLQEYYNYVIKVMQDIGDNQGLSIKALSSFSSKKKGTKKAEPYKEIIQKFSKPYKTHLSDVYYDFLYTTPPTSTQLSGFEITPQALTNRVDTEGVLLNSFGGDANNNVYKSAENISLTPVSIMIDNTSINIIEDLDNLEEVTTNALLAAELEVKNPRATFTGDTDTIFKLMEQEGAMVVPPLQKTLTAVTTPDEFVPTDMKDARPVITKGKKQSKLSSAFAAIIKALAEKAKQELQATTAKALYLEAADTPLAEIALSSIAKITAEGIPDEKHSYILGRTNTENLTINGEPSLLKILQIMQFVKAFYKANPSIYITRFMNAYQLEYVSGYDMKKNEPIYEPLNLDTIGKINEDESLLVRMVMKAGIPIDKDYTIRHSHFLVTTDAVPIETNIVLDFLPTIANLTSGEGLNQAATSIAAVSPAIAAAQQSVFESPIGGQGLAAITGLAAASQAGVTPPPQQTTPPPSPPTTPQPPNTSVSAGGGTGFGSGGGFNTGGGGFGGGFGGY